MSRGRARAGTGPIGLLGAVVVALAGCKSSQSEALVLLEVQIASDVPPADHLALSVTDHAGVPVRTIGLGGGKQNQTIDVGYYMNASGAVTVQGQAVTASGCVLGEGTVAATAQIGQISPAVTLMVSRDPSAAICAANSDGSTTDGSNPDGGPPPPPRLIAPLSTSTVRTAKPTLHWALAAGDDGAHVELCHDRACTIQPLIAFDAAGNSGAPAANLQPGVWFWRAYSRRGGVTAQVPSPVWQFTVGVASTPVDTSWGTTFDVNGDGYADVVVGAGGVTNNTGKAYVFLGGASGVSSTPFASLAGPDNPGTDFGDMVASAGDVNGDGFADLMIAGEGYSTATSMNIGRVYIYLGGRGTLSAPDATLTGQSGAQGHFGAGAAAVGDVNGDGYGDVVIGAQGFNSGTGIAYLYLGGPNGLPTSPSAPILAPDGANSGFAISLASAGDVNGDGYGDVIIGASGAASSAGKAYIYLGSSSGLPLTPNITFPSPGGTNAIFGYAVAGGADVNGDGYADVVVTAPGLNSAYSFHGAGGTGPGTTPTRLLSNPGAMSLYFGRSAARIGDVNRDGYDDVIISDDSVNSFTGVAYVYLGGTVGLVSAGPTLTGPDPGGSFGAGATAAGDVNGDGYADFIIGASGYNTSQGRAYVYVGAGTVATAPAFTLTGRDGTNGFFGSSVAIAEPPGRRWRYWRLPWM
jgi:hypothetical protein